MPFRGRAALKTWILIGFASGLGSGLAQARQPWAGDGVTGNLAVMAVVMLFSMVLALGTYWLFFRRERS